jgi:hypothetical protein
VLDLSESFLRQQTAQTGQRIPKYYHEVGSECFSHSRRVLTGSDTGVQCGKGLLRSTRVQILGNDCVDTANRPFR